MLPADPSASGIDAVEFHVQTNPGTAAGPMMKVASGGELSRFMLALKVVLADKGSAPTLVFDEIDSGVGGAVADAIGQRLARLAGRVQVLAVTHAPQVAARAASHFLIAKASVDAGERVATSVAALEARARREEIAACLPAKPSPRKPVPPPSVSSPQNERHRSMMEGLPPHSATHVLRLETDKGRATRLVDIIGEIFDPTETAASAFEIEDAPEAVKPWLVEIYFADPPDEEAVRDIIAMSTDAATAAAARFDAVEAKDWVEGFPRRAAAGPGRAVRGAWRA